MVADFIAIVSHFPFSLWSKKLSLAKREIRAAVSL
jgi:hypothetical protein